MRATEQVSYTTINNSTGYDGLDHNMMDETCIYCYILEIEKVIQVYASNDLYILV